MDKSEFEDFLYKQIPITKKMGITIEEFTPSKVRVKAKLEPNINHKSTAFGGSINTLMTICGWAMTFINIKRIDPDAHIVIQRSNIEYLKPINGDFTAECELKDVKKMERFIKIYKKRKKARINLEVTCNKDKKLLAKYEGQYVAFK